MPGSHNLPTQLAEMDVAAGGRIGCEKLGATFAWGATLPSAGAVGYKSGCIFTVIGADIPVHRNVGSRTSAKFLTLSGAGTISVADAGNLITATNAEEALAEFFQDVQTEQAFLELPINAWMEADGTAMDDHSAAPTPGWSAGDESAGIYWAAHSTPDPVSTSVPIPPDLDATADVVLHILAAKVGATEDDAVTFTVEAFNNTDGALYDADTDFGGVSGAMTGDADTKTCQGVTLTFDADDVAASPTVLTLTLQPTDGTLETDDVILLGAWLEYKRQTLTA